ncbi:PD40 domain-containing protein [Nocardioides sp. ChNu-153]|uniref:putative Ig domain-containing protein n=1 Tax=unclassified Nocardioides TaxID=2615069 RepID=UPI002404C43A|nr:MULTISPECIES: putative Ig domain-containing protein [unclassified Nocardioides]MDF9714679.1 putative Ig domain-containing protein [Nocardioides sp. ChNu-99]MDN7119788.1 PD40 domain-containing protein [Nocardioides sp. ChNu-153]
MSSPVPGTPGVSAPRRRRAALTLVAAVALGTTLATVPSDAAQLPRVAVSATPRAVLSGNPVTVAVRTASVGASAKVTLQGLETLSPTARWTSLTSQVLGRDAAADFRATPRVGITRYRAVVNDGGRWTTSAEVAATGVPRVTPTPVAAGAVYTVTGHLPLTGGPVHLQEERGTTWTTVAQGQVTSAGFFRFYRTAGATTTTVRVAVPPTSAHRTLMSPPSRVPVTAAPVPPATETPRIATTSLPAGRVGSPYDATLALAAPRPGSWSATGLPAGLALQAAYGRITGTPATEGTTDVAVTFTADDGTTASATLPLAVAAPAPDPGTDPGTGPAPGAALRGLNAAEGWGGTGDVSADGRWVVHLEGAPISAQDLNGGLDVVLLDTVTGARRLVSHVPGQPARTGDQPADAPAISGDGSTVAYTSWSTPESPGTPRVVVWERATGTATTLPLGGGAGASTAADLSQDGRYVAFERHGLDAATGAMTNRGVVVLDRTTGEARTASVAVDGDAGADGTDPSISADGSRVAFTSTHDGMTGDDTDAAADVFLWTRDAGTPVSRLSRRATAGDGWSTSPSISADGTRVAFVSDSASLVGAGPAGGHWQVYLWVQGADGVRRLSGSGGAPGDGPASNPVLSADGRHVAWGAAAPNQHPGTDGAVDDAYVLDLADYAVTLLSQRAGDGAGGDGPSFPVALSADGRFAVLTSSATNLIAPALPWQDTRTYLWDRLGSR